MKAFFKKIFKKIKEQRGYTLAELSISTSIIAMLAVGGLAVIQKKSEAGRVKENDQKIAKIQYALEGFIRSNKYVPCPAILSLPETDVNFGISEGMTVAGSVTSTTTYNTATNKCDNNNILDSAGSVPIRTLNLEDEYSYDGWGRKFTFITAEASGAPEDFNHILYRGDLAVIDRDGSHKTNINRPKPYNDGAIYVLISYGSNGKNVAWRKNDTTDPAQQAIGLEGTNTNHTDKTYIQAKKSSEFDDIVTYGTKGNFKPVKNIASPIKLSNIVCENAYKIVSGGRSGPSSKLDEFEADAEGSTAKADLIYKAAQKLEYLCENEPTSEINPSTIPGLALWLDADDPITLFTDNDCSTGPEPSDSASIGCWADKSGNGYNATQTTTRPTYETSEMNGKPIIKFNGSDDSLAANAAGVISNSPYTMIAAMNINSGGSENPCFLAFNNASNNSSVYCIDNATNDFEYHSNSSGNVTFTSSSNLDTDMIFSSIADGTNIILSKNGTSLPSQAGIADTANRFTIGAEWDASLSNFIAGEMAEIIIYDRVLSSSEKIGIDNYLADKWNITLASTTSLCPARMTFTKDEESPAGDCRCPSGMELVKNLKTTNACHYQSLGTFSGCVPIGSAPDYASDGLTLPTTAGMNLWLDANDCTTITLSAGGLINTWADKSPKGNNITQGSSSNQPAYNPSELNGKPSIRFDGSNDYLDLDSLASIASTAHTVIAVFNAETAGNSPAIIAFNNTSSNSDVYTINSSNGYMQQHINGSSPETFSGGKNFDNNIIMSSVFASGNLSMSINGKTFASRARALQSANRFTIGAEWDASLGNYLLGDIAEVIIYDRAITNDERQTIETYLIKKWDIITTPTDISTSDMTLWLDASDSETVFTDSSCTGQIPIDGKNVECWKDKSGNAHNATQSIEDAKPKYKYNAQNNREVILFDGTDDALETSSILGSDLLSSDQSTVFLVSKPTKSGMAQIALAWQSVCCTNRFNIELDASNRYRFDFPNSTTGRLDGVASVFNTWNIYSGLKTPTNQYSYNDGTLDASKANILTLNTAVSSPVYIGSYLGNSNYWEGQIGEIIIFNRELTTVERKEIEHYLGSKWGI